MTLRHIFAGVLLAGTLAGASAAGNLEQATLLLAEVKAQHAPDARQIVDEITARQLPDGTVMLGGVTSEASVAQAAVSALTDAGIPVADSIIVYPTDRWAQVRIPAASLRTAGRHAAEMATQAVMGTPLRLLDKSGEWWRVQTPDGYIAYIPSSSAVEKTDAQMAAWRRSPRMIVSNPWQVRIFTSPTAAGPRDVVTDLVIGSIVEPLDLEPENGRIAVTLPDGRSGWADAADLTPVDQWAAQEFNPDLILDTAYSMEGTPYLWGGTSPKAIDCSGLAKVSYLANGIILMRDASQQATTGTRIEASAWPTCQAGDLLFFGNARTGRVTHVAIYDHDGNYVHSSGRVKRNSVDPASESYLTTPFLHAVRINGNQGTRGITRAADHPWYF